MILNDFMVRHYIMPCFVLRMANHLSICFFIWFSALCFQAVL